MVDLDKINSNKCFNEAPQNIDTKEVVNDVFVLYKKLHDIVKEKTLFISLDKSARTITYTLRKMFEVYDNKRIPVSFINFSSRDCYNVQETDKANVSTQKRSFLKEAVSGYRWKFVSKQNDELLSLYFANNPEQYDFDTYDNIIIIDDVYASGRSLHDVKNAIEHMTQKPIHIASLYKYSGHKPKIDQDLIYAKKKDWDNNYKDNFNGIISEHGYLIVQKTEDIVQVLGCTLSITEKDNDQRAKFLEQRRKIREQIRSIL